MKNRIVLGLSIGVALLAGLLGSASTAAAQRGSLVTIPFAFEANQTAFPAGDYKVRVLTSHLIELTDTAAGTYKALLLVRPEQERQIETRGRMIFLHGEKQYFLSQIRFEGFNVHANLLLQPSLQRELAKVAAPDQSKVEIYMK